MGASKVHKLVVDLEGVGVGLGPTFVLHSVHARYLSSSLTSRELVSVSFSSSPVCMAWAPARYVSSLLTSRKLVSVPPSSSPWHVSKYYYCITSWCKAVTNELVWFVIKTVGVPLSYYWHILGCAIKPLSAHPVVCR